MKDLKECATNDKILSSNYLNLDYSRSHQSKNEITEVQNKSEINRQLTAQMKGSINNFSENRAVLFTATRDRELFFEDSTDKAKTVVSDWLSQLELLKTLVTQIRSGDYFGNKIESMTLVGIGGSSLGFEFVYDALKKISYDNQDDIMKLYTLVNIDPLEFNNVINNKEFDPTKNIVIICSKSWGTKETLQNSNLMKQQQESKGLDLNNHFIAISSNVEACVQFGIDPKCIFGFDASINGRFSINSVIGWLPLAVCFGIDITETYFKGGRDADYNLATALKEGSLSEGIILGIIGYLYCDPGPHGNIGTINARCITSQSSALSKLHEWQQQVDMESNGKTIQRESFDHPTLKESNSVSGPFVFGGVGTVVQHSFYQQLHQSGHPCLIESIGFKDQSSLYRSETQNQMPSNIQSYMKEENKQLQANLLGQADALMFGQFRDEPIDGKNIHKKMSGNRPNIMLLCNDLNVATIGYIMAVYEHRVCVEGYLTGVNSFDQEGVQLGKSVAEVVFKCLTSGDEQSHDNTLREHIKKNNLN